MKNFQDNHVKFDDETFQKKDKIKYIVMKMLAPA